YLVATLGADVFRRVGGHIHLLSATAVGDAGKELHGNLGRPLAVDTPLVEECVAFAPEFLADDRLDLLKNPLALRLQRPRLLAVSALRVVHAARAFGDRIAQQPLDSVIRELRTVPRPVALLIEKAGDGLEPAMLPEQFKDDLPDRGFLRIKEQ